MHRLVIAYGTRQEACSFGEGDCRALEVSIVDKKFKTHVKTSLTKGKILKETHECNKMMIEGNILTIETETHLLTVILQND